MQCNAQPDLKPGRRRVRRGLCGLAACLGLAALLPGAAMAAGKYPAEPIKLVVPYPAGGATDLMARSLAQKLAEKIGQSVVVENRSGAAGSIGADFVARAKPDGYTLLYSTMGVLTINPSLYKHLNYDPVKSFEPIALTHVTANMLVVNPAVPAHSVAELAQLAKKEPGKLTFSSSGIGSSSHLSGELFKSIAHVDILHVPYKGTAPAISDFLAGRITMMFDTVSNFVTYVKNGKARALGVTAAKRLPTLPDIPAIAETPGFENFDVTLWSGVLAPAGTPKPIIDYLNKEIVAVMKVPAMKTYLEQYGIEPLHSTPEAFTEAIKKDGKKWGDLIRQAHITAQ
ncbi:Bug family tripartite tricarboxylate transporter substrate binding protein [Candidimonas nitroreducens]|nr:tripartite tricarboxylate transporter substrate binding protein [Candidimonas nitroreducens]